MGVEVNGLWEKEYVFVLFFLTYVNIVIIHLKKVEVKETLFFFRYFYSVEMKMFVSLLTL